MREQFHIIFTHMVWVEEILVYHCIWISKASISSVYSTCYQIAGTRSDSLLAEHSLLNRSQLVITRYILTNCEFRVVTHTIIYENEMWNLNWLCRKTIKLKYQFIVNSNSFHKTIILLWLKSISFLPFVAAGFSYQNY